MTSYACWFWGHLSINCLITLHDNAPSLSWIFTKYANEWPPRKKINTKKEPEVVNTKKDPEVVTTKKEPEMIRDLWPLTHDPWPLTSPTKKTLLLLGTHSRPKSLMGSYIVCIKLHSHVTGLGYHSTEIILFRLIQNPLPKSWQLDNAGSGYHSSSMQHRSCNTFDS